MLRVLEYLVRQQRAWWRNALVNSVISPVVFLLALGVGLGSLVDDGGNTFGVPYLVFVAPAFLCATTLQRAAADASFPVMAGFKWNRTYHGIAATPVTPGQIADGTLLYLAARHTIGAAIFLGFAAAFGGTQRWWVLLAIPAAVLCALAFAAPVIALSASLRSEGQAFNVLFRFVVVPMFLFSGTFYPIGRLPEWGRVLAYVSPLWHGTQLARGAAIGHLHVLAGLGHAGYLLLWLVVGVVLARWRFRVRVEA